MLRKLTLSLLALVAFYSLAVRADTLKHGPFSFNLKKGLNATTDLPAFTVSTTGQIKVEVEARTSTILPNDPTIRIRAELIRPNGTVAASKEMLINWLSKKTSFTYEVKASDLTGSKTWKVRIRNIDTSNRMPAEGKVTVHYPTTTQTQSVYPSAKLTLLAGQTEYRFFKLTPNKTGRLRIEATWNTDFFGGGILNPVPLRLKLQRPNGSSSYVTVKTKQGKSELEFTYDVQAGDISHGREWRIEVHNPNTQGIADFTVKVKFTPNS
jgi:hypothetical protein